MRKKTNAYPIPIIIIAIITVFALFNNLSNTQAEQSSKFRFATDTVYIEKIIHDTVVKYVDTTPIVFHKKAFLYIKDTFNIDDRTYYITDEDDTVKVFYFDYTYYIFNYSFADSIVRVDSVIGCDMYTHCLCDERERIVIFHTCDGESRMIVNMLNKKEKGIQE